MNLIFRIGALLLFSLGANAAPNTILYVCTSESQDLVKNLLAESHNNSPAVKLTIGQDQSAEAPLFEVRLEGLNADGKTNTTPITVKRVALVHDKKSGKVALTYAPHRSSQTKNVRTFNLLISPDESSQISFVQINNQNAPVGPFELDCAQDSGTIVVPKSADLTKLTETEQLEVLAKFERLLPYRGIYINEDDEKRPSDFPATAEQTLAQKLNTMAITEEWARKELRIRAERNAKVEISQEANKCGTVLIDRARPIRDMTGLKLGYRVNGECKNIAVTVTYPARAADEEPQISRYHLEFGQVFLTTADVLSKRMTTVLRQTWND